eukprot:Lithocolla_globosa_v1_NODE_3207_length_1733_cov_151.573897.p3 type:complete len:123 gc:universal NODE_3207_length_1733_cov_151.573897:697-329(-)
MAEASETVKCLDQNLPRGAMQGSNNASAKTTLAFTRSSVPPPYVVVGTLRFSSRTSPSRRRRTSTASASPGPEGYTGNPGRGVLKSPNRRTCAPPLHREVTRDSSRLKIDALPMPNADTPAT